MPMIISNQNVQIEGLRFRRLCETDVQSLLDLQAIVFETLEDPTWYYPSDFEEFLEAISLGAVFGYFQDDMLCGFGMLTPETARGERSYAIKIGKAREGTYDLHDVMVHPKYRCRGMHTKLLGLFEEMAREAGAQAIYATVDPENGASYRNFERAGYVSLATKPAYDGRLRRYYCLTL